MKLIELEPRWFTFPQAAPGLDIRVGLTFRCPRCRVQRLGVSFEPAIDPLNYLRALGITWPFANCTVWHRKGDTFETLSLTPSIDASGNRMDFPGHWHGYIKNGEVV